jgi:MFS transporter, putative metabolite:H+ symporter
MQTTGYGVILWAPTLIVMLLGVSPAEASYLFIVVSLAGFGGRFVFSGLSELIGRRAAGALQGFGSATMIVAAGLLHDSFIGTVSVFWLLIIAADFFFDGGSAIMGPYAAEVWPSALRTSGMGSSRCDASATKAPAGLSAESTERFAAESVLVWKVLKSLKWLDQILRECQK